MRVTEIRVKRIRVNQGLGVIVSLPKKAGQMVPATFCVHSSSTNEIDVWYTREQNVCHGRHVYEERCPCSRSYNKGISEKV